jgi:hypothetical protein
MHFGVTTTPEPDAEPPPTPAKMRRSATTSPDLEPIAAHPHALSKAVQGRADTPDGIGAGEGSRCPRAERVAASPGWGGTTRQRSGEEPRVAARKKVRQDRVTRPATKPSPRPRERPSPGRPSKLTPETGWKLVGLLVAGVPLSRACEEVGVSRRTAQRWRARAWSTGPDDALPVPMEKAIQRGKLAAAEVQQPRQVEQFELSALDELFTDFRAQP